MKTIDELDALYAEMEDAARRATEGAGTLLHAQSAFHASTVAKEVFRSALVNAWPEVREQLKQKAALPVIKTCGDCGWARPRKSEWWHCGQMADDAPDVLASSAPPAACPLRAALTEEPPR